MKEQRQEYPRASFRKKKGRIELPTERVARLPPTQNRPSWRPSQPMKLYSPAAPPAITRPLPHRTFPHQKVGRPRQIPRLLLLHPGVDPGALPLQEVPEGRRDSHGVFQGNEASATTRGTGDGPGHVSSEAHKHTLGRQPAGETRHEASSERAGPAQLASDALSSRRP